MTSHGPTGKARAPPGDTACTLRCVLRPSAPAGVAYSMAEEWGYAASMASKKEGCTSGTRDEHNEGKRPEDFQKVVNDFISERRQARVAAQAARGEGPSLLPRRGARQNTEETSDGTLLPHAHAYLSLDEVVAVRLYSGPAFQPINEFLRQLALVTGSVQLELARHPQLSFIATVGHLSCAVRKLAAVATEEESSAPLFRGVRGHLPKGFFIPDAQGLGRRATTEPSVSASAHRSAQH